MPIIQHFRATTILKAFLLNSLLISFNAAISIFVFHIIDKNIPDMSETINLLITFIVSFFLTLSSYLLFFYIFNFGGGMVTAKGKELSLT